MEYFLLLLFIAECLFLIIWGNIKPERVYEYPYLAGLVLIAIILVQLIGFINSQKIDSLILIKLQFMIILCTAALYFGYKKGQKKASLFNWEFQNKRLLISSVILSSIGGVFLFLYSRLPLEYISGYISGIAVIYNFFGMTLLYGFSIALLLYLRTKSKLALLIVLVDSFFYLDRIFIAGRRAETFEFIFAIFLAMWFVKKILIPRKYILLFFLIGILLLYSTADYRKITLESNKFYWEDILKVPFFENIKYIISNGGYEVEAAAYEIAATDNKKSFDFGLSQWDRIIYTYFPSYLYGYNFKESLMFNINKDISFKEFGFARMKSTTKTGFTDAFQSFWYFGFINFFLIAFIMGKLYYSARKGKIIYQIFYILILSKSLMVITHSTSWFFMPWVHIGVFLFPFLMYSKISKKLVSVNKILNPKTM